MQYSLNLECYRDGFLVPSTVVNQHLKLAGALQLKVLLWICGNKGYCTSIDNIAKELGASSSDVQDALQYWICNNIIVSVTNTAKNDEPTTKVLPPPPAVTLAQPANITAQLPKPSRIEVAKRSMESEEISWLMCEAQACFGRTLSFAESSTLIWLMDTYGISAPIILMVIQYATMADKCNIKFIQSTAIDWATKEIDTVLKAETYLTRLEQAQSDWHLVCRVFGIEKRRPTKSEETYVQRWLQDWNFNSKMLKCAYDSCVNNTGKISFAYINKVLNSWFDAGFKKPEDIVDSPPEAPANQILIYFS